MDFSVIDFKYKDFTFNRNELETSPKLHLTSIFVVDSAATLINSIAYDSINIDSQ